MTQLNAQPDPALAAAQPPPGPREPSARAQRRARPRSWTARVALDTLGRHGAQIGLAWVVLLAALAVFAPLLANSVPLLVLHADGGLAMPFLEYLSCVDVTLFLMLPIVGVPLLLRPGRDESGLSAGVRAAAATITLLTAAAVVCWPSVMLGLKDMAVDWRFDAATRAQLQAAAEPPIAWYITGGLMLVGLALLVWTLRRGGDSRRAWVQRGVLVVLFLVTVGPFIAQVRVAPPRLVVWGQWRADVEAGKIDVLLRTPVPFSPQDRGYELFDINRPHPQPPSWTGSKRASEGWDTHLLGTDKSGADVLSKMIWASRIALSIGLISTGIAVIIGVTLGGLMGYFAGPLDLIGMRLVEIFSAIPTLYLLLACVAFFGRSLLIMMIIIGLTGWVGYALFARAEFLKLRKQDFVQAGKALGLPLRSILFKHILPNAVAPILVSVSFGVASAILAEASLAFLGFGVIDQPSWGALLDEAISAGGGFSWWLATFPGLAIFLTVFGYNLVGEALRDAIDPHTQRR